MSAINTIGLDLAKNVFQVHGADGTGRAVLRKKLRRAKVSDFFGQLPPCIIAKEECGGVHFWGREIGKLGHDVRLIPPAYVKSSARKTMRQMPRPFVKFQAVCAAIKRSRGPFEGADGFARRCVLFP